MHDPWNLPVEVKPCERIEEEDVGEIAVAYQEYDSLSWWAHLPYR